jgi:hypothetical protein
MPRRTALWLTFTMASMPPGPHGCLDPGVREGGERKEMSGGRRKNSGFKVAFPREKL